MPEVECADTDANNESSVLSLHNIRKSYGSVEALRGLNLTVERGQIYGFLGRNGAGKSTTLRIVMGITRASKGNVELFGQSWGKNMVPARQRIGYVAQEQNFYGWMTPLALGNFVSAFYPRWNKQAFEKLLRRLDIPNRKLQTFSGGMKVKTALAIALAPQPDLLVLDEPTAGLDPVVRREFIELIHELALGRDRTVLFSSHLIDEVEKLSTRIGILEEGVMRFEGSLSSLASRMSLVSLPIDSEHVISGLDALRGQKHWHDRLSDLPVEILHPRVRLNRLEFFLWGKDAMALASAQERMPEGHFTQPPLEEIFIALVRRNTTVAED